MAQTTHSSDAELARKLENAKAQVSVGAIYAHYKNPDKHYKVTGIAVLEATDEPCVLYEAQYGEHFTFVRALSSWCQTVETEQGTVARFQQVTG